MSDDDRIAYLLAERELEEAMRALSAIVPESVEPEAPLCSFCGKGINQVQRMVAGPTAHICGECVAAAQKLLREK